MPYSHYDAILTLVDVFPGISSGGTSCQNWGCVRQTTNFQSNGPITDVSSSQMTCYELNPGRGPTGVLSVGAGSTVSTYILTARIAVNLANSEQHSARTPTSSTPDLPLPTSPRCPLARACRRGTPRAPCGSRSGRSLRQSRPAASAGLATVSPPPFHCIFTTNTIRCWLSQLPYPEVHRKRRLPCSL